MKRSTILMSAVLLASTGMFADSITATDGSLTSFSSTGFNPGQANPVAGAQGTPFWNNYSYDGTDMNVGYLLSNTGGFSGGSAVLGSNTVANALLGPNGADPDSFNLLQNGTNYNISILYASSSLNSGSFGTNFGWYDIEDDEPILHQLYGNISNTNSPLVEQAFAPSASQYGFYATVCYIVTDDVCTATNTFFSDSSLNNGYATAANGWNHFALFNLNSFSEDYVIAFDDASGVFNEGIGDFNDLVIQLSDPTGQIDAVPEPATLSIVGLGLLGLGFTKRRFSKK